MKIVICATTFPPALGGLENVAEMTADALGRGGDDVTVLTRTPGPAMPDRAYRLIRRPSFASAWRECRAADAAVMVNVGLKMLPPLLASRTPFAIWHHTLYHRVGAPRRDQTYVERAKGLVAQRCARLNVACSDYLAAALPPGLAMATVHNPYDPGTIYAEAAVDRTGDLLFVGRLVSEKGVDVLLRAMAEWLPGVTLSIVGAGPEEDALQALTGTLDLRSRVRFLGVRRGADLRRAYNAHRVVVVPSVGDETFGLVALEGLACGCEVVVSRSGGIGEAVGPHGRMFQKGEAEDCARAIREAMSLPSLARGADAHLARHTPAGVAAALRAALLQMVHARRG